MKRKFLVFIISIAILCGSSLTFPPNSYANDTRLLVFELSASSSKQDLKLDGSNFDFQSQRYLCKEQTPEVRYFLLPPFAKVISVKVKVVSSRKVPLTGTTDFRYDITGFGRDASNEISNEMSTQALHYELGRMRQYNFIKVYFVPFEKEGSTLKIFDKVQVEVHIAEEGSDKAVFSSSPFDEIASKMFSNYDYAKQWYKSPLFTDNDNKVDYLIILSNSTLEPALSEFVKFKEDNDNLKIRILTLNELIGSSIGDTTEEHIRNYIKSHYIEWGLSYVLLVGGSRTLPMCYMYPEPNEKRDEDSKTRYVGRTPTDFFYSELDSNWDYDQDKLPGEFEEDTDHIEDFYPDVFVGRIPFDNPDSVRQVLSNSIKYERSDETFRKSALLVGAMLYYAEEGTSRQDGALALNFAYENFLKPSGFEVSSMYESEGTKPSVFESSIPLTNENFVKEMKSGKYGLILWNAHGSPDYIARKYWVDVNQNGEVNSGEIKWINLLSLSDVNAYKLAPSIIYAASCETAWPEKDNLSKGSLLQGAAAYIGASRISYGGGTIDPILENFTKHFTLDNLGLGDSLALSLFEAPRFQKSDFVNLFDYNLYGDPSLHINSSYSMGIGIAAESRNLSIYQGKSLNIPLNVYASDLREYVLTYSVDIEGIKCQFDETDVSSSYQATVKISCDKNAPTGDFTLIISALNKKGNMFSIPVHLKICEYKFSLYDINQDGKIDQNDLLILFDKFGSKVGDPRYDTSADLNADGVIDGTDLILFSLHYGD